MYRAAFFDALASACPQGLSVFAGKPRPQETIEAASGLSTARLNPAENIHLFNKSLYLCWQRGLLHWLEDWDPQALVVEANPRYLSTSRGIRWMKARHRPVIGWSLGSPAPRGVMAALRLRSRINFIRQFDGLITYSQRGAEEYRSLGYPPGRIWVAPNAVTRRPTWALPDRGSVLNRPPVVLFVGRLQARKRIENLLSACAMLASGQQTSAQPEALKLRLQIVGEGPEKERLQILAKTIYPGIEFLGARHGDDLVPCFLGADLFVLPGTGGLAIQQAMAYGLPVIAAEADGTQDDLVRPENGLLVPPNDVTALTAAINNMLEDTARLRQMGAASYRIVAEEINLEAMVNSFLEALSICRDQK